MFGPYFHSIDPIIGSIFGVHLWWYGLSYSVGFLNAHRFIRRRRSELGLSLRSGYDLSLLLAGGVLLGGRFVEVAFYEWPFYREHLCLIPAYWLGGMATHGLLIGGLIGIWSFCRLRHKSFLSVTDALAIPAAFILGVGRIGNFIDGQIVGSVTTVLWAVKFPDAEGFRHPVVLYDGIKNLLIIPVLLSASKRHLPSGALTGMFLFLYAFLRIFIDIFREYPTTLLGLATGQSLNIFMSILGLALLFSRFWSGRDRAAIAPGQSAAIVDESLISNGIRWRRFLFTFLLLFSLSIPSDWTQDVPARYGKRHSGLYYSALYPKIGTTPEHTNPDGQSRDGPNQ
jgi:phosphatidylglycerol:prolipoprotein diacylglycerol transferase